MENINLNNFSLHLLFHWKIFSFFKGFQKKFRIQINRYNFEVHPCPVSGATSSLLDCKTFNWCGKKSQDDITTIEANK